METLSASAAEKRIQSAGRPVVVCFTRKGSKPSDEMVAALARLPATMVKRLDVVRVDVDASQDLAKKLGVYDVPETLVYASGEIIERTYGAMTAERAEDLMRYLLGRVDAAAS